MRSKGTNAHRAIVTATTKLYSALYSHPSGGGVCASCTIHSSTTRNESTTCSHARGFRVHFGLKHNHFQQFKSQNKATKEDRETVRGGGWQCGVCVVARFAGVASEMVIDVAVFYAVSTEMAREKIEKQVKK
ncbi:hypothetical protein DVH24_004120 [Malus domestica]|uniref:Uncharacterized protein n=1 Tax=Malus domestica TaxID=3750 RepID=A0A498K7T5_MALDO|nr:hypothetical protein DVH24_004120 [Malus domestica]